MRGRPRLGADLVAALGKRELRWLLAVALITRLAVWLVATFAALLTAGPEAAGSLGGLNARRFDDPALTHPFGDPLDLLLAPLARWDAVWYLRIADQGYGPAPGLKAAFFPLYPLLVRMLGALGGGTPGANLVVAYLLSVAAFCGGLCFVYALVRRSSGSAVAKATVLLMAVFPGSLWFGVPYAESLFLLLSAAALWCAAYGSLWLAGGLAAAAAATRSLGVLLIVPLALYWWRRRRAGEVSRATLLALFLCPLGLAAFALGLWAGGAEPLAFAQIQSAWARETTGPVLGAWRGLAAAWLGLRQLAAGAREPVFFGVAAGDPYRIAAMNLMLCGFLLLSLWAVLLSRRRVPLPLAAWSLAGLAFAISAPAKPQPLMSMPRLVAVLFPLAWAVAAWAEERRAVPLVAACGAIGLGAFAALYAGWSWLA